MLVFYQLVTRLLYPSFWLLNHSNHILPEPWRLRLEQGLALNLPNIVKSNLVSLSEKNIPPI